MSLLGIPNTELIDSIQPVNLLSPFNDRCPIWLHGLPGEHGGQKWRNLTDPRRIGTLTNTAFNSAPVLTPYGGGVLLDGSNDYVAVAGSLTGLTSATFAVWANLSALAVYDGILFSRGTAPNVSGMSISDDGAHLGYNWNDATAAYLWNGGPTLTTNRWQWLCVSVSAASATAYVGDPTAGTFLSGTNTTSHTSTSLTALRVGDDPDDPARHLAGTVADVRLWSYALTAVQAQSYYEECLRNFPGTLRRVRGWTISEAPAAPGGRTTYNTRSHPLGIRAGINFRVTGSV